MAGEKSLEEKARKFASQRPQQGKEFEQLQSAQNQLLQIQAAQQQNLKERKLESDYLAQQNQTLAQAAQVGMMSQGAGQMRVNPATQNTLGRYGLSRPMTSTTTKQSQQSTVSRQNITIHNNTTNITTNNTSVPANIGGPIQGRPVQFQQQQQPAAGGGGGMDKFKNWLNQTFAKQDETRRQREREYQKRETGLTKSANKMMRKLEEFSRDISKKLDPRNLGKNMGSELKTIFRLIGLGALVVNFRKILSKLDKAQDKVENVYIPEIKNFFKWIRGGKESGAEEPEFITKIKESISSIIIGKNPERTIRDAFQERGLLGGIKALLGDALKEHVKSFKETLQENWEYARNVPKPGSTDVMEIGKYLVQLITTLFTGKAGYNSSVLGSMKSSVEGKERDEYRNKEDYFKGSFYSGGSTGSPGASMGLAAYTIGLGRGGYKYVAPEFLAKDKHSLASGVTPLLDKNGNFQTDKNGNILTREGTTRQASLAQGASFATLITDARKGKADPEMVAEALSRLGKSVKQDGEISIFWEDLVLLVGKEEAQKRFGTKKIKLKLIHRPKTIYEIYAERNFAQDETTRKVLNAVAGKALGISGALTAASAIVGGGTGAAIGGPVGGGIGALIGWGAAAIKYNPAVVAFIELASQEGINLYCLDYFPVGNNQNDALETAKLLYGDETKWWGDRNTVEEIVVLTEKEWEDVLVNLLGNGVTSVDQFGIGEEFMKDNLAILEPALKRLNTRKSYKPVSTFSTYNFAVDENNLLFNGAAPGTRGTIANDTDFNGGTIPLGDRKREQRAAEEAARERNSNWSRWNVGWYGSSQAPTETSAVGSGVVLPEDHPMRQQMEQQKGSTAAGPNGESSQIQTGGSGSGEGDFEGEQEETFTESSNTNFIYGADGAFDPVAAASWAYANYSEKTKGIAGGLCSDFVGMALRNGGSNAPGAGTVSNLEDYLKAHGWELTGLTADSDQSVWQIGDVAILYKVAGKRYGDGHACMYVGNNTWISDVIHQGGGVLKSFQDVRIYRYVDDPTANHSAMPGRSWNKQPNVNHIKYAVDRWFRLGKKYGAGELFKGTNGRSYDRVPGNKDAVEAVLNDPNSTVEQFIAAAYTPFPSNRSDVKLSAEEILSAYQSGGTNNQIPDIQYNSAATDSILGGKGMQNFLGFLSRSKEVIKNATGGLVHQVRYLADGTKQIYVKAGETGMQWENAYSGGLANYEHGTRKRSSAEQKIYDRYSGQSQVAYPTQTIRGKNRDEWWAGYFDENGNLKSKEVENINPELKKALDAIEVELKKSNGMDELQLKLAAESLDNTMIANAGATAREQRMINALVARNQVTEKAGMSTLGAERGINKKG